MPDNKKQQAAPPAVYRDAAPTPDGGMVYSVLNVNGMAPLIHNETGEVISVPYEQAKDLLQTYEYRPQTSEEWKTQEDHRRIAKKYDDPLQAGLRGLARGLIPGADLIGEMVSPGYGYLSRMYREANPKTSIATEIGGVIGGLATPMGPLGLAAKGSKAAAGLVEGAGAAARIGRAAITGAGEGAAVGLGQGLADVAMADHDPGISHIAQSVAMGAALGGTVNAGFAGAGAIGSWLFGKAAKLPLAEAATLRAQRASVAKEIDALKAMQSQVDEATEAVGSGFGKRPNDTLTPLQRLDQVLKPRAGSKAARELADTAPRGKARASDTLKQPRQSVDDFAALEDPIFETPNFNPGSKGWQSPSGPEWVGWKPPRGPTRLETLEKELIGIDSRLSEISAKAAQNAAKSIVGRVTDALAGSAAIATLGHGGGIIAPLVMRKVMPGLYNGMLKRLTGGVTKKIANSKVMQQAISDSIDAGRMVLPFERAGRMAVGAGRIPAYKVMTPDQFTGTKEELDNVSADQLEANIRMLADPTMPREAVEEMVASNRAAWDYLQSEAPKPPPGRDDLFDNEPWQPSDTELQQFSRKARAAIVPASVIDDFNHGTLTHDAVQAMAATQGMRLLELQQHIEGIVRVAVAQGKKYSQEEQQQINLLLGREDRAPKLLAHLQKNFEEEKQKIEQQKQRARPATSRGLAKGYGTAMDQIQNRRAQFG